MGYEAMTALENLPGQTSPSERALDAHPNLEKIVAGLPVSPPGMIRGGNLDPWNRKILHNADGSYSTTSSISVGTDAGETLIPTVIDGKRYSYDDAIKHFQQTGENFGTFTNPAAADNYATTLHNTQASYISAQGGPDAVTQSATNAPQTATLLSDRTGVPPTNGTQTMTAGGPDTTHLQPDFAQKIVQMIAASNGRLHIESGYRSDALQAQLYAAAVQKHGAADAGNWVAPPGQSNHNKGLAVDLAGDIGLAHQLAPQFGLEFPMSWEPWHIEPVGLREHPSTSAQAYTPGPAGSINPTQDPTLNSQPASLFARLSQALSGPTAAGVAGAGFADNPLDGPSTAAAGASAGMPSGGGTTASYSTTPGQGGSGAVKPSDLYKQLRSEGVDPLHAAALVSIAGRESGYDPAAHNGNAGTGDNSYGLFQINLINGEHSQFSPQMLSTTQGSAAAAAQLVKGGGLSAWGPYKGVSWSNGTNLQTGVDASGGEVTLPQLEGITNEGLH